VPENWTGQLDTSDWTPLTWGTLCLRGTTGQLDTCDWTVQSQLVALGRLDTRLDSF
jgi:hypothetical protein